MTAQSEGSDNEQSGKRSSEHLALWLTIAAIGFVAIRILIVARGDSDIFRALVQNLNVTAIVLATILPLVTTVIWLLFVLLLISAADKARTKNEAAAPGERRTHPSAAVVAYALVFGPPVIAVCWFAMPMKYAVFAGVLSALLVIFYVGSWRGRKFRTFFQTIGALVAAFVLIAGVYVVIAQVGVWLPRERLSIGNERTGTVYVLSSDQEWTKYLDDQTHKVKIIPTKDVLKREAISDDDTWTNKTLSEMFD
ncbi:hypothetical protein [Mycobacterium sp. GA-2829]|uniref:hypothetical protein n=1 Tax=Mycobacterium sp. GA-2829 TaxID=1772283 RepID=UPI0012FB95F6|nr:hypothetical protein [Mycobacterium sp. GA-2829]